MYRRPGSSLSKPLSILLGIAATLLVMAAPQAASRPFGCEAPRQMAAVIMPSGCQRAA